MHFNQNNRITYGGTSIRFIPKLNAFEFKAFNLINKDYVLQAEGQFFGDKKSIILYNGSANGIKSIIVYNSIKTIKIPFYITENENDFTIHDVINCIIEKINQSN